MKESKQMKPLSACMESMRQKSNVVSADAPDRDL